MNKQLRIGRKIPEICYFGQMDTFASQPTEQNPLKNFIFMAFTLLVH